VFLRQALERRGMAVEPRMLLSVVAGAAVYIAFLAVFARSVARELLRMLSALGFALRPQT